MTLSELLNIVAESSYDPVERCWASPDSHWDEILGQVVPTTLHHGPGDGGQCEDPLLHCLINAMVFHLGFDGEVPAGEPLNEEQIKCAINSFEVHATYIRELAQRMRAALASRVSG